MKALAVMRLLRTLAPALVLFCLCRAGEAAVTGSITGVVKDPSGAMLPHAHVIATMPAQGFSSSTESDGSGSYAFPSLSVGRYTVQVEALGFSPQKRSGVVVDADGVVRLDLTLQMNEKIETITVVENAFQLDTSSTQTGEIVTSHSMTAVALNGRSFTDLLALQAGIIPTSTQTADSIVMAGATVAIAPSGGLNPGNQSINGQREDANGFVVNGGDVKELMNGGTAIVPNLDSIAEFMVLTNNFDAEYGNSSGGVVNVITKSGTNDLHGSGFEFLRNTDLDARNFFSPERSFYRQNQYGGTAGGAIRKNKAFFFADYQGTRTNQGIDTGLISVPSAAERTGNLADIADSLTGSVGGPYFANLLSQRLGYKVTSGEPYYSTNCVANSQCVFPGGIIPQRAWSPPSQHLLPYIPTPNSGATTFSSGGHGQKLRDDKGSLRLDGNARRWGMLSAYYFLDDYYVDNPYPTGQGGASVPGFNALNIGRAQLVNLGATTQLGGATVNELRLSFMRTSNNVGEPSGGVGPTLASQGFVTGVGSPGIVPLAPSIEGIENVVFNSFVIGTPITNLKQANNTFAVSDNLSRAFGKHTFKAGIQLSIEKVNVNPNPTFNGSFLFSGSETGSDFADFLIGVASNYNQADSQSYYPRHRYAGGFVQDSWRVKPSLTLNYGVRWDLMEYWSEKYNQVPTFIPGEQSKVFTDAPAGLVYAGDAGVPDTLVPTRNRFAPRLGLAWSPGSPAGLLDKITGGAGKSSVRAGYGMFYSVIQGNTLAFDEPQPPYGLSYTSPGPPLFDQPFRTAADGAFSGNPFPLVFPPFGVSPAKLVSGIDFSAFEPIAGMTAPPPTNTYPYNESYFFSIERQFGTNLASVGYAGSQAHHLLVVYSANPGNPGLCLALSHESAVAPGTATCGPFAENQTYLTASGKTINGTRSGLGSAFSNDDYNASVGNSNYNSLQASLKHSTKRLEIAASYTFSKSIDQASSLSDPINPFNFRATRTLSAFDLKHDLVTTFEYRVVQEAGTKPVRALLNGWGISGIARASSGFPVTLRSTGDNSLTGSIPNGVNNYSLDLPDYNGTPLALNHNPRNGPDYFNTGAFTENTLGTPGNASRRSFHGPGALNFDLALLRTFDLSESRSLQFRFETFNAFNHAQFFGPSAVNGNLDAALFGQIVKAAPPRLAQVALKFVF